MNSRRVGHLGFGIAIVISALIAILAENKERPVGIIIGVVIAFAYSFWWSELGPVKPPPAISRRRAIEIAKHNFKDYVGEPKAFLRSGLWGVNVERLQRRFATVFIDGQTGEVVEIKRWEEPEAARSRASVGFLKQFLSGYGIHSSEYKLAIQYVNNLPGIRATGVVLQREEVDRYVFAVYCDRRSDLSTICRPVFVLVALQKDTRSVSELPLSEQDFRWKLFLDHDAAARDELEAGHFRSHSK